MGVRIFQPGTSKVTNGIGACKVRLGRDNGAQVAHRETEAVGAHGGGQAPLRVDAQRLSQERRQLWASDKAPGVSSSGEESCVALLTFLEMDRM